MAGPDARLIKTELERQLKEMSASACLRSTKAFLDSDDLKDLSQLQAHVRDSDCLVAIVTDEYFTRPFCLLWAARRSNTGPSAPLAPWLSAPRLDPRSEMWVALALERPVFVVEIGGKFDRARVLAHLACLRERLAPDALAFLERSGVDVEEAAALFASVVRERISTRFDATMSKNMIAATIKDLIEALVGGGTRASIEMPSREQWLHDRSALLTHQKSFGFPRSGER